MVEGTKVLIFGIIFSFLLTGLIWVLTPYLSNFESTLLPDSGADWYFWKLPVKSEVVQIIVWSMYALHQLFVWGTFYYAMKNKIKWSDKLGKYSIIALLGNLFFVLLRIFQTHLWYDGLAQDAPIWTSQWSVILFLSFMLIIDNFRRGFIAGKKMLFSQRFTEWIRKYHGYYFYWAFVYTFWFHPTTGTLAHLYGFLYMFLLFLQGSLMYNRIHLNKYWMVFLESFVILHATLVALFQSQALWTMFFSGFLGMFVFTYMFGLGLSKKAKIGIFAAYLLVIFMIYAPLGLERFLRFEIL
ncbi:MAG: hypothetical protein PHN56_05990, partial [Candidatus Nanoarchaeia archaeon]|nr:hypothetical protein [Candidatus Nanoarchaeia archaeon]